MIETTHGRAYSAFLAANQIRNMVTGIDALHVFQLKNKLKEAVEFLSEEEMRLVQESGGTVTDGGMVIIPDAGKKAEYLKSRKELDEMLCEIDMEPITIMIDRCPDVTVEQIEMLNNFVIFREE